MDWSNSYSLSLSLSLSPLVSVTTTKNAVEITFRNLKQVKSIFVLCVWWFSTWRRNVTFKPIVNLVWDGLCQTVPTQDTLDR